MKILLTAIFKGDSEINQIKRMLESYMPHVDGLVAVLTGLNEKFDELVPLIKKYNGEMIITSPKTHPKIYAEDTDGYYFASFSEARNVAFDHADTLKGYDWYTWADADDILVSGKELRNVAKQAGQFDAVFMTYWYAIRVRKDNTFNHNDVQIEHTRERLIKPKMFKWVSRLHEVAVPRDGNYKPVLTEYKYDPDKGQHLVWAHLPPEGKPLENMKRNVKILESQIKEEEHKDPRTVFYLAKTYYDLNTKQYDGLALFLLDEYLHGDFKSGWSEERANAWQYVANILSRKGRHEEAVNALHEAVKEFPGSHMHYLLMVREYNALKQYDKSSFWLEFSMKLPPPEARTTIGNPLEIKLMAANMKYNEAIRKVDLVNAVYWLKVAGEIAGSDVTKEAKTLEDAIELNETAKRIYLYAKWLKDHNYTKNIPKLLESLPYELGVEPFAHLIANEVMEPKKWGSKTIVYYASWGGQHFEKWSPKNMDTGIGGSETAVIELAKRWVEKGYDVYVYGDPREDEGDYAGVHYRPWYELNWKDTFNTLILWRSPHLLDKDIKAKKLFYDAHDVESNLNWTPERVKKINRVFFKSKFHRAMVPNLPDEKVAVISNGI